MIVSKYDRQLRLWGHSGQRKLGQACVALLGCSGGGIEAIKNLVLPGIGSIHIFDDQKIQFQDLSNSFFFGPQDVGKYKSQIAAKNLLQMNPDVTGRGFCIKPINIFQNEDIKKYSLIIASDLKEQQVIQVSKRSWQLKIPVIFITTIGFYCYIRIQKQIHIVQSQKIASKKYYMRINDPFPQLDQYCHRSNIKQLFNKLAATNEQKQSKQIIYELEHIPYPIILLQVAESLDQKQRKKSVSFKSILRDYEMKLPEGQRTNFIQAQTRTLDFFQPADIFLPDIGIFDHLMVEQATIQSEKSVIFLRACKQFYKNTKTLPQPTQLPDMHTNTKLYLELKEIYKKKHEKDIKQIQAIISNIFKSCPLSHLQISEYINQIDALQILSLSKYSQQLANINNNNLTWEDPTWRLHLLAIRSYQKYINEYQKYPNLKDLQTLKTYAQTIKNQYGFQNIQDWRSLQQIARSQGKTMISISSIAGAVAGQQAIKLITNCFTPVRSGYLYSGVDSTGYGIDL